MCPAKLHELAGEITAMLLYTKIRMFITCVKLKYMWKYMTQQYFIKNMFQHAIILSFETGNVSAFPASNEYKIINNTIKHINLVISNTH